MLVFSGFIGIVEVRKTGRQKAVKQSEQYSKCSILLNEQTVLKVDHGKVQLAILPVRRKTWKKTLNDHFQKCEEDKKAAIYLS